MVVATDVDTTRDLVLVPDVCLWVSGRIKEMRTGLHEALVRAKAPGDWTHVLKQIGMFSYTGLTTKQVQRCCRMLSSRPLSSC